MWHNSVSHYNYYYNASVLIADVKEETMLAYKDNFKDVLSLYPMLDQNSLKGNSAKMDEVLKKCSHIIEKHGKSKWVDDSYLLMGDARLYKGEFYAAIEVYEFVANSFKNTMPAAQAEINLVTTYLHMEKYEDAEALYTRLAGRKDFAPKLKTQLLIAGAAVNIKQGKHTVAIKLLEEAIPKVRVKHEKVRYNFVLAQLYGLTKNNIKALEYYRKVVKLNPQYEFAFNAKLNMAKSINTKNRGEVKNAKIVLRDMLRDDKNKEYFDQIYYELGNLELADRNEKAAIEEYTNSLRSNGTDMGIKSSTYLALADLYFKNQDYEHAQVYYDSAARTVDPAHPNYEFIQTKNQILNELIKHLVNIKEKDSLLRLSMDEKLMEKTIDNLIKEARDKADEQKHEEEMKKLRLDNLNQNTTTSASTNFPFYNQAAKTKGAQDFQRIWGNRAHLDFWAISSNKSVQWDKINEEMNINDKGRAIQEEKINKASDERKPYYENIAFTEGDKQKLRDEIAESYFLGANVYYEHLKEYDKAKKMLEELNAKFPGNKYELNAWYLLARIHRDQKEEEKAKYYIDLIEKKDPKSNFLMVLLDSGISDSTQTKADPAGKEIDSLYSRAYTAFKMKNFDEALLIKKENDSKFPGNPLQVNFDYLDALITAEKGDMKSFQTKLQAIVDNYPGTEIANQAARTIMLIKMKSGEGGAGTPTSRYKYDAAEDQFYMLLLPSDMDVSQVKIAFLNYHKSTYPEEGLRVTNSVLGDQQVLIVNNLKTLDAAKAYITRMRDNKKFFEELKLSEPPQYLISKSNFQVLISDKNLDEYVNFYKTNYIF